MAETRLTRREKAILALIEGGASNKEIARRLGISVSTVKNHLHNALKKLKVHTRSEAIAAIRHDELP